MSESVNPLFTAEVVYQLSFAGTIKKDLAFGEGNRLLDLYLPENPSGFVPVVVIVSGYPDAGFRSFTGIGMRDIAQYVSWSKLIATSGMAAITYSAVDPIADAELLLAILNKVPSILGAALNYGYTLDLNGATHVADAAEIYHFANPVIGEEFIRADVPLLLVRAGADQFAGINRSIDAFTNAALRRNCRIHLINFPNGVHAFDIQDRSPEAQELIREELSFLRRHLSF